jgi:hypothetical protein
MDAEQISGWLKSGNEPRLRAIGCERQSTPSSIGPHTMRDMTTWFCDAYASWQKGGIENANGRLRRWLPRHLDIDRTSDQDIQEIIVTTNLTPLNASGSRRHSKP